MKKIFLLLMCITALHAQSIVIDAGASVDVSSGADVCPGSIGNISGTLTGLGTICNSPLPVELVSFKADCSGKTVKLFWQSILEVNCSSYFIERREPVSQWKTIAEIKAAGNSNAPLSYSYSDNNAASVKYEYRLKILDKDGQYQFSPTVEAELKLPAEFALAQNYPNPFNPSTTIEYQLPLSSAVNLTVYNITGERISELVNEVKPAGYYSVNFSSANLSSGFYIYRITIAEASGRSFTSSRKMLIVK
jgi:hypothetical protein